MLGPVLLAVGLVATACGGSDGITNPVRTSSIPTGADEVVVRVDTRGGFTAAEYQLAIVPEVTVFGDGRVVVHGPETEQYPPHALPNLSTGTLARAEVVRLLRHAADADLLAGRIDAGQPAVSDLPTTTVSIDDGRPHEISVYALGASGSAGDVAGIGVNATQAAARRRVSAFVRAVTDAAGRVATESYRAHEVAVYVRPATPDAGDTGVTPGRLDWPLGDLATIGSPSPDEPNVNPVYRCALLTGADAATVLAAAADASSITRWRSGGTEYTVVFRPLLPDEHTCP